MALYGSLTTESRRGSPFRGRASPFFVSPRSTSDPRKVAAALMAKASDLFSQPPSIEKVEVLAAKLPG